MSLRDLEALHSPPANPCSSLSPCLQEQVLQARMWTVMKMMAAAQLEHASLASADIGCHHWHLGSMAMKTGIMTAGMLHVTLITLLRVQCAGLDLLRCVAQLMTATWTQIASCTQICEPCQT